ncbi:hypothetical protein ACFYTF_28825 [Nocardia thailandica]|uniref:Uncharacterized protein n=1 Tax=Nocardia thailandica TaxID=257275 RepID=A0ABW6PWN4_9NOCA
MSSTDPSVYRRLLLRNLDTGEHFPYEIVPDERADPEWQQYPESAAFSQALLGKMEGAVIESILNGEPVRAVIIGNHPKDKSAE